MKKEKTCKNCFCWKQKSDEPNMGFCLKSSRGKRTPPTTEIKQIKKGIAIRFKDGDASQLDYVLFGEGFGCIHFEKNKH